MKSLLLMLFAVGTTIASASAVAEAVVLEALAVELEAAGAGAVADLWCTVTCVCGRRFFFSYLLDFHRNCV